MRGALNIPSLHPTPELAYVIGTVYSDGYVYTKGYHWNYMIRLCVKDKEFANEFSKNVSIVLGKESPYSVFKQKDGRYVTQAYSKILTSFLDKKRMKLSRPHQEIIETYPASFLRGFFDGDGGVSEGKIEVINSDTVTLQYIKSLLTQRFKINTGGLTYTSRKGDRVQFPHGVFTRTRDCYKFQIRSKLSIIRYYKNIGFSIERKQKTLEALVLEIVRDYKKRVKTYWRVLNLKSAGYGPTFISRELKIPKGTIDYWLYSRGHPRGVEILSEFKGRGDV